MLTGELKFHVQRVLWRNSCDGNCGQVDHPVVGTLDPVAVGRILHNWFVDDINSRGTKEEVDCFVGKEDMCRSGTIPTILGQAGLHLNVITVSREVDGENITKWGAAVGYPV